MLWLHEVYMLGILKKVCGMPITVKVFTYFSITHPSNAFTANVYLNEYRLIVYRLELIDIGLVRNVYLMAISSVLSVQ